MERLKKLYVFLCISSLIYAMDQNKNVLHDSLLGFKEDSVAHQTKTIKRSESKRIQEQHIKELMQEVTNLKNLYQSASEVTHQFRQNRSNQVDEKFSELSCLIQEQKAESKTCFDELKNHIEKLTGQPVQSLPKKRPNKTILLQSLYGVGFLGGSLLNYFYNDASWHSHFLTAGLGLHGLNFFAQAWKIQASKDARLTKGFWSILSHEKIGDILFKVGNISVGVGTLVGAYSNITNPSIGETRKLIYGGLAGGFGICTGRSIINKIDSKLNQLD